MGRPSMEMKRKKRKRQERQRRFEIHDVVLKHSDVSLDRLWEHLTMLTIYVVCDVCDCCIYHDIISECFTVGIVLLCIYIHVYQQ